MSQSKYLFDLEYSVLSEHERISPPDSMEEIGFGSCMVDHMFIMEYSHNQWKRACIKPYGDLLMDPASQVFHYGQAIFEGMKAYKKDEEIYLFRPEENMLRMNRSAQRMMMPTFDGTFVLKSIKELCLTVRNWIPNQVGSALYLRPTMIAKTPIIKVAPSEDYLFFIIACPVSSYYKHGFQPISIYVTDKYVRACPGGVGKAKAAGNYGAALYPTHLALEKGFDQVLWLDGTEPKYLEEVGVMNLFSVMDGKLITPALNGSILPGVTRDSILQMVKSWQIPVIERRISITELIEGIENGSVTEVFGSGTAAVITPIGHLHFKGQDYTVNNAEVGSLTKRIYQNLIDIQYGLVEDPFSWRININQI